MARPDELSATLADELATCVALLDESSDAPAGPSVGATVQLTAAPGHHGLCLALSLIEHRWHDATDALIGTVAPGHCHAIGALQDLPVDRGSSRLVHLVHRSGLAAWTLQGPGMADRRRGAFGIGDQDPPPTLTSPAHKLLDDACRRALRLPTSKPATSTVELWTALWLDALVARAAADPRWAPVWSDTVRLHPTASPPLSAPSPDELVLRVELLAHARPWELLRRACAGNEWSVAFLPAQHAAWMDDGMFSRWVLAGLPPVVDLAAAAVDLLPAATASLVSAAVARMESL